MRTIAEKNQRPEQQHQRQNEEQNQEHEGLTMAPPVSTLTATAIPPTPPSEDDDDTFSDAPPFQMMASEYDDDSDDDSGGQATDPPPFQMMADPEGMQASDNGAFDFEPLPFQFALADPDHIEAPGPTNTPQPPTFQLKAEPDSGGIGRSDPEPFQVKDDSNTGLPGEVQMKMEQSFNTDFSDVKIHTNSQSATDVGALAYTQGTDVHFAPGQFKPDTSSGQELIGHELTHVVQQKEGRVEPTTSVNGQAVNDDKSLEKEADQMGAKAAAGESISGDSIQAKAGSNGALQAKFEGGENGSSEAIQRKEIIQKANNPDKQTQPSTDEEVSPSEMKDNNLDTFSQPKKEAPATQTDEDAKDGEQKEQKRASEDTRTLDEHEQENILYSPVGDLKKDQEGDNQDENNQLGDGNLSKQDNNGGEDPQNNPNANTNDSSSPDGTVNADADSSTGPVNGDQEQEEDQDKDQEDQTDQKQSDLPSDGVDDGDDDGQDGQDDGQDSSTDQDQDGQDEELDKMTDQAGDQGQNENKQEDQGQGDENQEDKDQEEDKDGDEEKDADKDQEEGKEEGQQDGQGDQGGQGGQGQGQGGDQPSGQGGSGGGGGFGGGGGAGGGIGGALGGALNTMTGGGSFSPVQIEVGQSKKSKPPKLFIAAEEAAKKIPKDKILQDLGDGKVLIQNVSPTAAADASRNSGDQQQGGNKGPIQMAPDPNGPKTPPIVPADPQVAQDLFDKNDQLKETAVNDFANMSQAGINQLSAVDTAIDTILNGEIQKAKGVVNASLRKNENLVRSTVVNARKQARMETTKAKNYVEKQHSKLKSDIRKATRDAEKRIKDEYNTNFKALNKLEKDIVKTFTKYFDDAVKDTKQVGIDKGNEAKKIAKRRSEEYANEPLDEQSGVGDFFNGSDYPANKRKAKVSAAIQVGDNYYETFTTKANEAAGSIGDGKAEIIQGVRDKIEEARKLIKAKKKSGLEEIKTIHTASVKGATKSWQQFRDACDAKLEATMESLKAAEEGKLKAVRAASKQFLKNVEETGQQAIVTLKQQVADASIGVEESVNSTVQNALDLQNADPEMLRQQLGDLAKSVQGNVGDIIKTLNDAILEAGKGVAAVGKQGDQGLTKTGKETKKDTNKIIEGLKGQLEEIKKQAKKSYKDQLKAHKNKVKGVADRVTGEIKSLYKETKDGIEAAGRKLKTKLGKSAKELGDDFQKELDKIEQLITEKANEAEDAVQPAWKKFVCILIDIIIAIVVTAAIVVLMASGFGLLATIGLAFAIGAAGGIVKTLAKNAVTGKENSLRELAWEGFIGGVGGLFTLAGAGVGGALSKAAASRFLSEGASKGAQLALAYAVEVPVGTAIDTAGSVVTGIMTDLKDGKEVTWESIKKSAVDNLLTNFLGNLGGKALGDFLVAKGVRIPGGNPSKAAGEATEAATESVAKEVTEEATEQTAKEVTEEAVEQTAKEVTEEAVEQTGKEVAEEAVEQTGKEVTEEAVEQTGKEVTEEAVEQTGKEVTEETVEQTGKEVAEETVEQTGKEVAEETTEQTAKEVTEETTEQTGKEVTEEATEQTGKEATEEAATQTGKLKGSELAEQMGYPKAPKGYHWANYGGKPVLRRNPVKGGSPLPQLRYNPTTGAFDEVGSSAAKSATKEATGEAAEGAAKETVEEAGSSLKPLGRGNTGRTAPNNMSEKLAMDEIMSNPSMGEPLKLKLGDARWPGWKKMHYVHRGLDGSKVVIHFVAKFENGVLKAVDDFKFK